MTRLHTIISTILWTSNSAPDSTYLSCKQYCNPTSENNYFVCTIFNCGLIINSENWAQYYKKPSTISASKAKKYFVWYLWFQFYYDRGCVRSCVYNCACLYEWVYEYACNFGIGLHFQKQPKPIPRNKQK